MSDCVLWKGRLWANGYGRLAGALAHRVIYELAYGPIPDGLHVLHQCDVKACINPAHLTVGTRYQNMQEAIARGRQSARLSEPDVRDIRAARMSGRRLQEIADEYGVSASMVGHIEHGRRKGYVGHE